MFKKRMCHFMGHLKRNSPVKMRGGGKSFTMMGFTWQDSIDMMKSNESVKLLLMIPVLLYKTSTDRISLDQF